MTMGMRTLSVAVLLMAVPPAVSADKKLDDGRLEPEWFGAGALEFRESDELDYLWVKPGFVVEGRKLRFAAWQEAEFKGENAEDRDLKDKRLASELTEALPGLFADAFANGFGDRVPLVEEGEEVTVIGRIVDCSTGSEAAKFWVGMGAGSGFTTFDVKFVDAASGETLAAIHHRVVSGTNWSTTDSKLVDWIDEFTDALSKKGFEKLYKSGDRARD